MRDLASTVRPVLQMLRDIGGVRISDRFAGLEDDARVPAGIVETVEAGGDGAP